MIPLGRGPVPTTAAELADRLGYGVRRILQVERGDPRVDVRMSRDHIDRIAIDITGLSTSGPATLTPGFGAADHPSVIDVLAIDGDPVGIRGVPVTLSAEGRGLPVAFRTTTLDDTWIVADDRSPSGSATRPEGASAAAPTAWLEASARLDTVEDALRAELDQRARAHGFTLKSLALDVRSAGRRGITLRADATVGKSFLSAKVTATATVTIDDDLVLLVSNLALTSGNPLVTAILARARGPLDEWDGRRVDLTAYSFAGARLRDVELSADDAIRFRATFGG